MKCYVINLDRSPERLLHMQTEFQRLGLSFIRVSAIDGQNLNVDDLKQFRKDDDWFLPSRSEFGCFMSHRECWKRLISDGGEYAAIFEDDVYLKDGAIDFLRGTEWLPNDIDLLKIETVNAKVYLKRWGGFRAHGRKMNKTVSFQSGTGGYIISKRLAQWLLVKTEDYISSPIDHYLFDPRCEVMQSRAVFQLSPAICIQDLIVSASNPTFGSTIHERSVENMIRSKRGTLSRPKKILREIKRGVRKLSKLIFEKRVIVLAE